MKLAQNSQLLHRYKAQRKSVDARLKSIVNEMADSQSGEFGEAIGYTLLSGGKRIRPVLVLSIYRMFAKDEETAINAACAIELLHASSLMLDDLPSMDNASVRRGKSTSHTVYSESTTILAAAALWTKSYGIIAEYPQAKAQKMTAATADLTGSWGLILGQYYDLTAQKQRFSVDELINQYNWKTASLFRLSVVFGAILGDASEEQVKKLDEFAKYLGIAFQIHDDINDATMTVLESGKDAHLDAKNHKQNIVDSIGVENAEARFNEYMKRATDSLESTGADARDLVRFIDGLLQ